MAPDLQPDRMGTGDLYHYITDRAGDIWVDWGKPPCLANSVDTIPLTAKSSRGLEAQADFCGEFSKLVLMKSFTWL